MSGVSCIELGQSEEIRYNKSSKKTHYKCLPLGILSREHAGMVFGREITSSNETSS